MVARKRKKISLPLCLFCLLLLSQIMLHSKKLLAWQPHLPFEPHFAEHRITLSVGKQCRLKIHGITFNKKITYHSSHSLVASVTPTGQIHAWKKGSTLITATLHGRKNQKIYCVVFVK